jgi:hypothetical protein
MRRSDSQGCGNGQALAAYFGDLEAKIADLKPAASGKPSPAKAPSQGGLRIVTDSSRLKERTIRMLEHALELAAQGYSLEKIETLLHYAGYSDARQRLWWPILSREVNAAAERARQVKESDQ